MAAYEEHGVTQTPDIQKGCFWFGNLATDDSLHSSFSALDEYDKDTFGYLLLI